MNTENIAPEENDNLNIEPDTENKTPDIISTVEDTQDSASTILEKTKKEKAELEDKYLRLVAEFDNFKKRNAKERLELIMTANRETIISLLDVLDDCDRASKQFEKETSIQSIIEGSNLIFNKFKNIMQQKGLKKMEVLNNNFDLEQHEAITEIEVEDTKKGKVVDVVQDGYLLNDKIVRFAKVVVGK